MGRMRTISRGMLGLGAALAFGLSVMAQGPVAGNDAAAQADAQKQLHGKQFRNVQVQVVSGVATLTGSVDRLSDKLDAEKRIEKTHETSSINDQISVQVSENISDSALFQRLGRALAYDRQGYGTLPFNSITVQVQQGVVTLGGEVVTPDDKQSAVGLVTSAAGVRGFVDHLVVAPLSPNDWQLRRALLGAIYNAPQLQKYAIDPVKPIRIVVINGHVTLVGAVLNSGDRDIAGLRANAVPGVFSVANDIQVQGQGKERVD